MPELIEEPAEPSVVIPALSPAVTIARQTVALSIDPVARRIEGNTSIELAPTSEDFKSIQLHCRQAQILRVRWKSAQGLSSDFTYMNPYDALEIPFVTTAHQHEQLKRRLPERGEPTVELKRPANVQLKEQAPYMTSKSVDGKKERRQERNFETIFVFIDFVVDTVRDGIHFVGWDHQDQRFPHFYTQTTGSAAVASLFPCVDSIDAKYLWDISIKTPRTIGDALARHAKDEGSPAYHKFQSMSETDKALDLSVMCSGDLTDEIVDPTDPTMKTSSFKLHTGVAARHIGFAIGPFEEVNLAAFRESDEDDRLGRNAVPIHAFCLPGRTDEVKNTCLPLAKAMDHFAVEYTQYPFTSFKLCFIDDLLADHHDTASLSLCSNEILFSSDIIDPFYSTTRQLVFALASQWSGINLTAEQPNDLWVIIGIAYFMTDHFLKTIFGNNEYRYQQKVAAGKVCDQDNGVPSMFECGKHVTLDRFYYDFIALKAPVVLFILDRRLLKINATHGLVRMIAKAMRDDIGGKLSTQQFLRLCERAGHTKLESFFNQWVYCSGCPSFVVVQRFNKKKLVVEMSIEQQQIKQEQDAIIKASNFMREVAEGERQIYAEVQACFVGPMTIRIHEADGTPYEHIIEIKEPRTKFEIPYNTKYKRLKRSRRQREKLVAGAAEDPNAEGADDVLLYCLGDNLASEEDRKEWLLEDWSPDDQEKMNQESYEWIRMDADFEWICSMTINMPGYMFVSQLQQDRDVVAQLDTVNYMATQRVHPLISTFLIRTIMDERYFHGVRTAAARALRAHSVGYDGGRGFYQLRKAFQELFCIKDSNMTSPNDFTDRATYLVQLAIVVAISGIRDHEKRAPFEVRRFLYEVLHYNDNGENEYSDCFYISALIKGLGEAVASAPLRDTDDFMTEHDGDDYAFLRSCWNEIERYQRRDGWIPSYHNVVSVTALYAKFCLDKAGCVPRKYAEYLYVTQPGNHEDLRVTAFSHLFNLGRGFSNEFLTYFFSCYVSEHSPRIRARLMNILNKFIGAVAIGEYNQNDAIAQVHNPNTLIIEHDTVVEARQTELARKGTVEGALKGLKQDLGGNIVFMAGIWEAVLCSRITVDEFSDLLLLCSRLYDAHNSVMITIKRPRWTTLDRIEKIGEGRKKQILLHFKRGSVRNEPLPKRRRLSPPAPTSGPIKMPTDKPKIGKIVFRKDSMAVPARSNSITVQPAARPTTTGPSSKPNSITLPVNRPGSIIIPPSPSVSPPAVATPGGGIKLKLKLNKPKPNEVNGT